MYSSNLFTKSLKYNISRRNTPLKDSLSRIACNLIPMVPPLEWKRFRSLGVYSSSLDMNFDSKWTIVIRWNSSYIWNTNNEISFKASNITSVHIVLTTFLKARSHLILVIIFIISPQEHRIEFGRIICYLVFDTLLPARVTWEGAGVLWGKDIFLTSASATSLTCVLDG